MNSTAMPRAGANRLSAAEGAETFPVKAGILLGLGLGGFFDGIVLHQILQWRHMLTSATHPADSLHNLEVNVVWDGIFHAATYAFTATGLFILWKAARRPHEPWPARMLIASMLLGFGLFNVVEGVVNHHILGLHHVNETAPPSHWIVWDVGFLVWGVVMLVAGWLMLRSGQRQAA